MMQRLSASRNSPGCQSSSVGTCSAAVQVGDHAAVEAQREGARRLAPQQHVEHHAPCRARRSSAAGAQRLLGAEPVVSHGRTQPVVQLARSNARRTAALNAANALVLVRAVADATLARAGVGRELQVVRGVADHQRALGRDAELVHQLEQHPRVAACEAVSSAVRVASNRPLQLRRCASASSSPRRRLAGGHRRAGGRAPSAPAASPACRRTAPARAGVAK